MSPSERSAAVRVIVNADDLGYDPEIDRGILEAHARGVVTSTTAMVGTAFSAEVLRRAPATLGIGLHAVLEPALDAARAEVLLREQIDRFAQLRGALPTHLDSHKHHHAERSLLEAFARVAAGMALPVRALDAPMRAFLRGRGVRTSDGFLGDASLRPGWTAEALAAALGALAPGLTEIMCHPGYAPSHAKTSFGKEREVELAACCDAGVRAALGPALLVTYAALH